MRAHDEIPFDSSLLWRRAWRISRDESPGDDDAPFDPLLVDSPATDEDWPANRDDPFDPSLLVDGAETLEGDDGEDELDPLPKSPGPPGEE